MIVVSDTYPIINLAAIGRLDILATLYGQILIPDAVYMEIVLAGAGLPGADDVRAASWIETRSIADLTLASGLQLELDRGEAEAISLAVDTHADLLLMDERRGRKAAARIGVPVLVSSASSSTPNGWDCCRRSGRFWMRWSVRPASTSATTCTGTS